MNFSPEYIHRFLVLSLQVIILEAKSKLNTTVMANKTKEANTTANYDNNFMKTDFKAIGLRAIYVIAAVSAVVVAYLVVRAVCSRRRKNRTRRYGMLSNDSRDGMEMRPLSEHEDEEDDDMTLFDISKRRGKR